MLNKIINFVLDPYPLRTLATRIIQKVNLGSYEKRLNWRAIKRPHYGYCVYQAAILAKKLGYQRISILEFGVAAGNGLVNLEYHAQEVSKLLGIDIEIYGFDTGQGLPAPVDYRDLPYHWKQGFFKMDIQKLQQKLKKAKLVLGDIKEISKIFFQKYNPAPIGAIMHDFDFYSSTAIALKMFEADEKYYLPRVYCYFDDTVGGEVELCNDYTGERLAINEFNQNHKNKKLTLPYHLLSSKIVERWYHKIFIYHDFLHSRYNDFVSQENQQIYLK